MEEEDFLKIEQELRELCVRIGAPEITEDKFFLKRETYASPDVLRDPRTRVLEQLDALDRHFSLYDRSVFQSSMQKIARLLQDDERLDGATSVPTDAVVLLPGRSGTEEEIFDLSELPDLTELREELRDIRKRLSES